MGDINKILSNHNKWKQFKKDGFTKLEGLVNKDLIKQAMRFINKEMGGNYGDKFKGKYFVS